MTNVATITRSVIPFWKHLHISSVLRQSGLQTHTASQIVLHCTAPDRRHGQKTLKSTIDPLEDKCNMYARFRPGIPVFQTVGVMHGV